MDKQQYDLARRLWHYGVSGSKIAEACGVDYYDLNKTAWLNRRDFPRRRSHTTIDAEKQILMERLRDRGMTYKQIAEIIGCHANTVMRHLRNYHGGKA